MSGAALFRAARECGTVRTMSFTVYFRDSEDSLHSLRHRAASESEALDWFTRIGIIVVAIRAEFA
jgi:hypothetical protein